MNKKENQPPQATASDATRRSSSQHDYMSKEPEAVDQPSQRPALRERQPQTTATAAAIVGHPPNEGSTPMQDAQTTSSQGYPPHVLLPFDLRDHVVEFYDVVDELSQVFPGVTEISDIGSYLHFTVEEFPPGPWPLTIAGLPFTISDKNGNGKVFIFPRGLTGRGDLTICEELDRGAPRGCLAFRAWAEAIIHAYAELLPQLHIVELMATSNNHLCVVVADDIDLQAIRHLLPSLVARMYTVYINDKVVCRPGPDARKALRSTVPDATRGSADNTAYDVLRPGVLLSSFVDQQHHSYKLISSGVLVENTAGSRFMTTASHGIGADQRVYVGHPSSNHTRLIGTAMMEVSFTDVALIELEPEEQFLNENFDTAMGKPPRLSRIIGELPTDKIKFGDLVSMETPFTGLMKGIVMARSLKMQNKPSVNSTEESLRYVVYDWFWGGQQPPSDSDHRSVIPDSTCGSAIVGNDGSIVGLFQFSIEEGEFKGFYAAVSGDEVVRAGYKLVRPAE